MEKVIDFCLLHGFWGQGSDWDPFLAQLGASATYDFQAWAPDLFGQGSLSPKLDWQSFSSHLKKEFLQHKSSVDRPNVLIGYSMGGRLALQSLFFEPEFWDAAILISTQPGGLSQAQAEQRKLWEGQWQERFKKDDWKDLLRDWNQQGVFHGDKMELERKEEDFSRELLSLAFDTWSVRWHACDSSQLCKIPSPVLWCMGVKDQKYVDLIPLLEERQQKAVVIPESGHRIHLEAPQSLAAEVDEFLHSLAL